MRSSSDYAVSMPNVLRPRQEFPTPLFALVVGVLAAGIAGLPGWLFFRGPPLVLHALASAGAIALVIVRGTSARRLLRSATLAIALMVVVLAVELVIAFLTADWE